MRFYTKHSLLLLALLSDKHRKPNWLDNDRLNKDQKNYIEFITGYINPRHQYCDRQDFDSDSNDQSVAD